MIREIFSLSEVTEEVISFIQQHQYLIPALTPFLAGEVSLHVFGILNGSGDISIVPFIIALTSIVVFDTLVFCTVRLLQKRCNIRKKMRKIKILAKLETVFHKCETRYSRYPALLLFAVKIVPMTKITIIFFSLWAGMSLARFLLWDVIISIVYGLLLFMPGWFVGKGLLSQEAGRDIVSVIIYFLILVVIMTLFGEKIDALTLKIGGKIARTFGRVRKNGNGKEGEKGQ